MLRRLLGLLCLAATLALWGGTAAANASTFVAQMVSAWSQGDGGSNPNGNCGGSVGGSYYPSFGSGSPYGYGPGYGQYTQWAFGGWNTPVAVPAGTTVTDATLSGWLSTSALNGRAAPAGLYGFGFAPGDGNPFTTGRNSGCDLALSYGQGGVGTAWLPAGGAPAPFSADAYALAHSYQALHPGDLFLFASGVWLAPRSVLQLTVDYAWTPVGLRFSVPGTGGGTQVALSWQTGGNVGGTTYVLERETLLGGGGASAWQTLYQGPGTGVTTADQVCGRSYVYRVAAVGARADTPWDVSARFDEHPCSVTAAAAGSDALRVSWPAGPPGADYVVLWCRSAACVQRRVDTGAASTVLLGGLRADTAYTVWACSATALWGCPAASAGTGANAPTPAADAVTQTAVTARWGSGGNPAGVLYQVWLQPGGGAAPRVGLTTQTTLTFSGLVPGSVFALAVQALGAGASPTVPGAAPLPPNSPWVLDGAGVTVPGAPEVRGAAVGLGWAPAGGRGAVSLSWTTSPGATGYTLYVWDGAAYEAFDLGAATTWSSRAAAIYPRARDLYPAAAPGSGTPPAFSHTGGGENLRDRPGDLYCTLSRAECGGAAPTSYRFAVAAYNAAGSSAAFQAPGAWGPADYQPTLPLQTDPSPPTLLAWSLGGGSGSGAAPGIRFRLQASEDLSGIAAYALSNDGLNWTTTTVTGCTVGQVAPCAATLAVSGSWALAPGPGTRTVWARVESAAGVWSTPRTAQVYVGVDRTVPTVDVTLDGGVASTASRAVTLAVDVTDPVTAALPDLTWQARYSGDGGQTWSPWTSQGGLRRWSVAWTIPGGAPGKRTVLVQVENSDDQLGQGGATIHYVGPAPDPVPALDGAAAGRPCAWVAAGVQVQATCVRSSLVSIPLAVPADTVRMRLSLDDVTWGPWQAPSASLPVDLGSGPGGKTVWVQFRSALGLVSPQPPLYYVYDPAPPVLRARWLGGASATDGAGAAVLEVHARDDAGPQDLALRVSENGVPLYDGPARTSLPLALRGPGYQLVQVQATDAGGQTATVSVGIYVE